MSFILRALFKFLFFIKGWKTDHSTVEVPKAVIVVGGHTSNWDFIFGAVTSWKKKIFIHFTIKESWVKFPFKGFMNKMGAFPIKRDKTGKIQKSNFVEQVVHKFNSSESFHLCITPEASRSPNKNWKSGFYHIAKNANVPIILGFIDYKTKTTGFGKAFYPHETIQETLKVINDFYKNITPRYPEKFKLAQIN